MSDAHPLLTDDQDPPGEWETGWIGGGEISFRRPINNNEHEYVAVMLQGDREGNIESRSCRVWVADVPDEHMPWNYSDAAETIGTGTGLREGTAIALEYMKDTDD